jgi:hypothetical protein
MCKKGDQDRKKKIIVSNIYIIGWNGERYENYMYKQNFDLCVYKITKIHGISYSEDGGFFLTLIP